MTPTRTLLVALLFALATACGDRRRAASPAAASPEPVPIDGGACRPPPPAPPKATPRRTCEDAPR